MPGMDRTGPLGTGPIGRRMGPCFGGQGGQGRGRGFGRGNRLGWNIAPMPFTQEEGLENLKQQKVLLESELSRINKIIEDQTGIDKS